jgi:hypothetical protein
MMAAPPRPVENQASCLHAQLRDGRLERGLGDLKRGGRHRCDVPFQEIGGLDLEKADGMNDDEARASTASLSHTRDDGAQRSRR